MDEEFVHAENKSIKTEPFEKFEVRAAFEKPELLDGLVRLKRQWVKQILKNTLIRWKTLTSAVVRC